MHGNSALVPVLNLRICDVKNGTKGQYIGLTQHSLHSLLFSSCPAIRDRSVDRSSAKSHLSNCRSIESRTATVDVACGLGFRDD